ncbi:WD40 repeat-like protein [Basidiobolus meristosporus CBS 931.73]|uniref:WD40 repeat-like protein n=1 Tax=Basidiobolus meristosporus CBS 931.73 TaxID=1314790 RepID=A0A1Y1YGG1_9FUNG|nr:WD40 repeat-like protein [Basidiobolus meristosporus CBS 931.73]|eukprot:ORX97130.1 WD40 repeat-like protein [Basidiobolus meristosporus CBS 931.73]
MGYNTESEVSEDEVTEDIEDFGDSLQDDSYSVKPEELEDVDMMDQIDEDEEDEEDDLIDPDNEEEEMDEDELEDMEEGEEEKEDVKQEKAETGEVTVDEGGIFQKYFDASKGTPRRKLQDNADTCKTYDIIPYVAAIEPYNIYCMASTRCMRWVFTGSEDGYVRKYDFFASMNGKTPLAQSQRHNHVDSVTKSGILLSYWENEEQTPTVKTSPEVKVSPVYSLAVQSEAIWGLTGLENGDINLWTVRHEEGNCQHVLRKHTDPVSVLQITPNEIGVVSGSWDRSVLHWDLNSGDIVRKFTGHKSQISSVAFQSIQPDEQATQILMTTSIDGTCLFWDLRDPKAIPRKITAPEKCPPWCLSACWSINGNNIYCGRRNGTVDEWDFGTGKFIRSLKMPSNSGPVSYVACMPNGRHLVCASNDNIRMWNLAMDGAEGKLIPFQIIPGHHGGVVSDIQIDETSKYMITTSGNRGWEGTSTNCALFYDIVPTLS